MGEIEGIVGSAGDPSSVSSRIVALESALIDASNDPSSTIRLSAVGNRLSDLTAALNTASDDIQTMRAGADADIASQVEDLNHSLAQVETLNTDITNSRNSGNDPSGLMDQRQLVIDRIAEIVPVRELDRDGGQVALMTPDGQMLLDGKAKVFGFTKNAVVTPDMTLASGGLSGITLDGMAIATDGVGKLSGGSLGAAFQARDNELVSAQQGLDDIAADLITRFQDPSVDTTLGPNDAGLLTDGGAAYDGMSTVGLSSRISVNAAVDESLGGNITNLRDGINATTVGLTGDATLLQSLSSALSAPRASPNDPVMASAAGRASAFESEIGSRRIGFEEELSFSNARWSSLKEAEAAQGVDTDHEMQMLLRVEQAYAANARVIQTVETMMQRLMEI
jgi:flagellar hook-associated protein 1 FlgK